MRLTKLVVPTLFVGTLTLALAGCGNVADKVTEKAIEKATDKALGAELSGEEKKVYDKCVDELGKQTKNISDSLKQLTEQGLPNLTDTGDASATTTTLPVAFQDLSDECSRFFEDHPVQAWRAIAEWSEDHKGELEQLSKDAEKYTQDLQKQMDAQLEELKKQNPELFQDLGN